MNTHNLWTIQVAVRDFFTYTWRRHHFKAPVPLHFPYSHTTPPQHFITFQGKSPSGKLTSGEKTTNKPKKSTKRLKPKLKTKPQNLKKLRAQLLWVEYWPISPAEVPFQLHSLAPAACCDPQPAHELCHTGRDWLAPTPELSLDFQVYIEYSASVG